ncbi:acyl carrier protein [Sphingobacterium sp. JB170]|uniref:acyl carrier protein n=1 Tax=Sphingobacterium sp. JB170 TaxID=1434842 RepID=UPI00097F5ABE|nr:acyl carrier protein [Sphingobacterium sp. JB170]SJN44405.1 Acyl carrier protein (ACP2) [Sphingobacterium sp. JB170]
MNKVSVQHTINEILIEEFEVEEEVISPNASLKESLDLDSLDYVDLVVIIESNFGVKLDEGDFAKMVTFQDFYETVEQKIAMKQ